MLTRILKFFSTFCFDRTKILANCMNPRTHTATAISEMCCNCKISVSHKSLPETIAYQALALLSPKTKFLLHYGNV